MEELSPVCGSLGSQNIFRAGKDRKSKSAEEWKIVNKNNLLLLLLLGRGSTTAFFASGAIKKAKEQKVQTFHNPWHIIQ